MALSEADAQSLRQEATDMLGIPNYSCPKGLKRKFYHLGLSLFPKSMRREEVRGLIGKTLNISDEQSEKVFQQLRGGGLVCESYGSGFVGDQTVLSLKEIRTSSGEVCYSPSTYNPMDF